MSSLFEIVLRTNDGEELQSTDKLMKVGDTFQVGDQTWVVQATEPAAGEGVDRLICGKHEEDPLAAGVMLIRLSNDDQGRHLFQTLRGHCEVDLIPGSEGTRLAILSTPESGTRAVLRRLDAWLREFGVESITIELDGHTHVMKRA